MSLARWSREQAIASVDPMMLDELGEIGVLELDDVSAADDSALGWCSRAPCVVVGRTGEGSEPPTGVDVVVPLVDDALMEEITASVEARPCAALTLVEVLRVVAGLGVADGLRVESLAYSMLLAGAEFAEWLGSRAPQPPLRFDDQPVRLERDVDEVVITLARPENRNAFSAAMRDALFEALTFVEVDDSVRRVRIRGDGPCFSSGGDLREFGSASEVVVAHEVRTRRSVGALLARLADRVEVTVHGRCVGAGVELPAFAGRVTAHPDATFRLPEIAMGLIPGAGGTVSLTRRMGRHATALLALTGREIDADTALRAGLVDEIG